MRTRHTWRTCWLARLIRGLRPDRNPLRRGTDRAGTAIGAVLLAAFAVAAPFAAHIAATWSHTTSLRELQAQQSFRQVRAVLLETPVSVPAGSMTFAPQARCRWTAPGGQVLTGLVMVPADAKAGSTVRLWTDKSGQLVTPLQRTQIPARDDRAAATAVVVLAVTALLAGWLVHLALNSKRMADWDADWLANGPGRGKQVRKE